MTHRPSLKFELALFDFDGTLADSLPWMISATQRLADRYKFRKMTAEEMDKLRDCKPETILSGFGISRWKMPLIASAMRRMMADEAEQIVLFQGIDLFLKRVVAQGLRVGIVSSNSEANVRRVLGPELSDVFELYECDISLLGKASKLRRAMKKAGVAVERTVYVGDEVRDLDAAAKARMAFAAVAWGFSRPPAFENRAPHTLIRDLEHMTEFLVGT